MTPLDVALQRWRIRKAAPHLPTGGRVLDVGTHDGSLFRVVPAHGLGMDPALVEGAPPLPGVELLRGSFPRDLPDLPDGSFDAVTALAVVEHVPTTELASWSSELHRLLRGDGVLVITVPAPAVDRILHVLMRLRLVAGMEAHQHHGFEPEDLLEVFASPQWLLEKRTTFQLGLNNLFVFRRALDPA